MAKQTQEEKRKQQLIDELLADYDGPESFWGDSGLFAQLKKKIVERALDAEMDDHLGYSKHDPKGKNSGNSRNGSAFGICGKSADGRAVGAVNADTMGKGKGTPIQIVICHLQLGHAGGLHVIRASKPHPFIEHGNGGVLIQGRIPGRLVAQFGAYLRQQQENE